MTTNQPNPDITVRGGLINVPALTSPTQPPRHQPNTPPTKKKTTVKADHKPYVPVPKPVADKTTEDPKPEQTDDVPEELE